MSIRATFLFPPTHTRRNILARVVPEEKVQADQRKPTSGEKDFELYLGGKTNFVTPSNHFASFRSPTNSKSGQLPTGTESHSGVSDLACGLGSEHVLGSLFLHMSQRCKAVRWRLTFATTWRSIAFQLLFPNSHAMGSCKTNRRTGAVGSPSELVGGWCAGDVLTASGSCDAGVPVMFCDGVPVMF